MVFSIFFPSQCSSGNGKCLNDKVHSIIAAELDYIHLILFPCFHALAKELLCGLPSHSATVGDQCQNDAINKVLATEEGERKRRHFPLSLVTRIA